MIEVPLEILTFRKRIEDICDGTGAPNTVTWSAHVPFPVSIEDLYIFSLEAGVTAVEGGIWYAAPTPLIVFSLGPNLSFPAFNLPGAGEQWSSGIWAQQTLSDGFGRQLATPYVKHFFPPVLLPTSFRLVAQWEIVYPNIKPTETAFNLCLQICYCERQAYERVLQWRRGEEAGR